MMDGWNNWNPRARAQMVRAHLDCHRLTENMVCELFQLTQEGLLAIRRGGDWHPAFQYPPLPRHPEQR